MARREGEKGIIIQEYGDFEIKMFEFILVIYPTYNWISGGSLGPAAGVLKRHFSLLRTPITFQGVVL
jgi:hypothetical protein